MMLTGIEYLFWVYGKLNGRVEAECCFTKQEADCKAAELRSKGYSEIRIEQKLA